MDIYSLLRLFPGKSGSGGRYLPLWMHNEDTAAVIGYLCTHRVSDSVPRACALTREKFKRAAVFLAMVHDIGKCTPLFSSRIGLSVPHLKPLSEAEGLTVPIPAKYNYPEKSPHPIAGEAILLSLGVPQGLCSVVGAHHGKPRAGTSNINDQMTVYKSNLHAKQKPLWESLWRELLQRALDLAGYSAPVLLI